MKNIKIIILVIAVLVAGKIYAVAPVGQAVFGSKQSSLIVNDDSYINVKPTDGVTFAGGNFTNTGLGVVTGSPIKFDLGSYTFFNSNVDMNGVLTPSSTEIGGFMEIGGDSPNGFGVMIANPGGLKGLSIRIQPGASILRGQPLFFGENDLDLRTDEGVVLLGIAVQNAVNTNIILNGGILQLEDDLLLGDSAVIKGDGFCLLNHRRLVLGGSAADWEGNITWYSALDIQLNSAVHLKGTWGFADESQINGNNNVIDLSGGGEIIVYDGATLRMAGVQLKGLGNTVDENGLALGKIRLGVGSTLIMSDVVIEMGDDYDVVSGTWLVEGSSKVITKSKILRFVDDPEDSSNNGKLVVDRVDFTYDTLAALDNNNVQPLRINDPTSKYIEIVQNGDIRSVKADSITFHNYRSDSLLQKYAIVAPYRKFVVYPTLNDDHTQNYDVEIDGNTNFMGFTLADDPVFIVSENVHATTKNMILRDVSLKHFDIRSGASLLFGDKTMLAFARNEVLNYPIYFKGNTILRGTGMMLEFGPEGAIILQGENSSLLLDGLVLKGVSGNNIRCESDTSTIKMRGVKWQQSDAFTFSTGGIELIDDVIMVGPETFTYASQQPFVIGPQATLFLTRNLTFNWEGAVNGLQLVDDGTAAIALDQVVVQASTGSGLKLDTPGRLVVRNTNYKIGSVNFDSLYQDSSGGSFK